MAKGGIWVIFYELGPSVYDRGMMLWPLLMAGVGGHCMCSYMSGQDEHSITGGDAA